MKKVFGNKRLEPWLLLAPALLLIILLMGYPIFDNIRISLLDYNLIRPKAIRFNNFANYVKLFTDRSMWQILRNSLQWGLMIVPAQAVIGLALAMLLNRRFACKNAFQSVLFLPWAMAGFMIGLIFRWIFSEQTGLLNYALTSLGIIQAPISWLVERVTIFIGPALGMVWYGVPFFAIMFLAALQSIPHEIIESSMIDGASTVQRFTHVVLAFIKPTIVTTLLLRMIWVFNSADVIYIMTGGGPMSMSTTLPLYAFKQAFSAFDFGYAATIGNVVMIVLLVYALFFLKITKYKDLGDF